MNDKPFTGTVAQMKTTPWLASEDFAELGEIKLEIAGVYEHKGETMQDGKKKDFFTLSFAGKDKRLVLNATNRKVLARAFGASVTKWTGQTVYITVKDGVKNPAGGAPVQGLRLRAGSTPPAPSFGKSEPAQAGGEGEG